MIARAAGLGGDPATRARLLPAFVDVDEGTYNIDADAIERMITEKTKALQLTTST